MPSKRVTVAVMDGRILPSSMRLSWTFDEVDEKLKGIMKNIFQACLHASIECGHPGDMMLGANVAGFLKVADAMLAQGIV